MPENGSLARVEFLLVQSASAERAGREASLGDCRRTATELLLVAHVTVRVSGYRKRLRQAPDSSESPKLDAIHNFVVEENFRTSSFGA